MKTVLPRSVLFCFAALCLSTLLLTPGVSQAATVNYGNGDGTNDSVAGNSGIINSGPPPQDVGNASGNTVNITGGTVNFIIAGGRHDDTTGSAAADNNQVNIATFTGPAGLTVDGGYAQARAPGNTATANGNTVDIAGGTFSTIHGGLASSDDGPAFASGNTVRVTGVTASSVYGGFCLVNTTLSTATNTANSNTVIVTDSSVLFDIFGGMAGDSFSITQSFVHNDNHVTLIGATTVGRNVYGGARSSSALAYNSGSGNTLNIRSPMSGGITVGGNVQYFQNYNFYIPAPMTAGEIMLSVGGTAYIDNTTVNVGIEGGSSPLKVGDSVVLIDAGTLDGTPANTTANGQGMQGVTLLYGFDLLAQNNQLLATVTSTGINPQLKSLSEGRAANLAFVNQGSDLILGPGLGAMLAATQGATGGRGPGGRGLAGGGFAPFAVGSGGFSRYDTGSHVDVSGVSLMTGLAWRQSVNEGKNGSVLAGAFFEAGWGNYDAHNSFNNAASVKGDGDLSYYGGGLLGRYDFAPTGPGTIYVDASFRAGRTNTDFNSSDLRDGAGRKADYDSSSAYYGMHAGLGYLWNITEKASLDFSTRYIWTHQNSDTVKVLGDPVKFKASDSHRWRTGARFAYAVNEYIAPYAGAYYDHEFDGKARASTNGYAIDAPDLKGGTGIGELGLTLKPSQTLPLSFDFGVQGYVGVREGVTGSLQVKFEF